MLHALRRHALPFLVLAGAAVFVTWPLAARLGVEVPGHPQSDTYDHLQGAWWFAQELHAGRLPLRTEVSHWPPGGALWYVDPLGGLFCALVAPFTGMATAYALACLLAVWGGMAAMYAVARFDEDDAASGAAGASATPWSPAVLAGVIFGGSPYVLSLLHSGTVEYLHLAPLPLAWAALRRAFARGNARDVALAAGVWTWAAFGSFYHAAFVALLLPLAAWHVHATEGTPPPRAAQIFRRGLTVSAGWLLLSGPFLWLAASTLRAEDAVVSAASAPGWTYASLPANDLLTFFRPGDHVFPDNRRVGNLGIRHVNYLGWIALLAAAAGAARERRLRGPLLVLVVLALGPVLWIDGQPVRVAGVTVPLPTALFYAPGSPFRMVHHPYRLVVLPMLLMALAAARAVRGRPALAALLCVGVLAETVLASPTVWPVPMARATAPAPVAALAGEADVSGVFTFPPSHALLNRRWSMEQTIHGKRVPYGVNAFLPEAFAHNGLSRALLRCLRAPARATVGRDGGPPLPRFYAPTSPEQVEAGRAALRDAGFDAVVLHLDVLTDAESACARSLVSDGRLRGADAEAEVWELGTAEVVEDAP